MVPYSTYLLLILSILAEVPQEHSHALIVNRVRIIATTGTNTSPLRNVDATSGLLADKGAGIGIASAKVTGPLADVDCLHQNIADACLTNAKAQNLGKDKLATCIQYAALERNTLGSGLLSKPCFQKPTNKELTTIKAHQDPFSPSATQINRAVEIAVAKQIFALGFNINDAADLALRTATFAGPELPGGTSTGGHSCDAPPGFIFIGDNPVPPVFANKDGVVLGEKVVKGQEIDCAMLATLNGDVKGGLVARVSKQEILSLLGNASVKGDVSGGKNVGK